MFANFQFSIIPWHQTAYEMNIFVELADNGLFGCSIVVGCTHYNGRRYLALPEGLEITEVMRLAVYSKYETTLKYYLAVKDDLVDRARRVVRYRVIREMLERCLGRGEKV